VAYDLVDDAAVRADVAALGTRMLDFLLRNGWNVVMPDGSVSTTFTIRADQQLTLLQIGRRINPQRFGNSYSVARFFSAASVGVPIATEVLDDHNSYFKFNPDTINLHNLIRLESSSYKWFYDQAYDLMRRTTDDHGNAHFNMIDRALRGPNGLRDANTRAYLRDWLLRPRRDLDLDLRGRYPACGADRACSPIPISDRIRTDFLWQRSPFLLYGGGTGSVETAGIDYLLPYWMGRYYGVIPAGPQAPVALSVSPASGSRSGATFQFRIWDQNGYPDVRIGLVVIHPVLSPANSCYIYDRLLQSIWPMNDSVTAWLGPAALGSPAPLQNRQCTVAPINSSHAGTGEVLTLNPAVFFPARAGLKNLFFYAQDAAGLASGWQQLGSITVP
jgi:hypothetical protein